VTRPHLRRTRIVATLGPASQSPAAIGRLIKAGVDVVRLNFSHGTQASHRQVVEDVRAVAAALDRPVAILQDLRGPKMRVGLIEGDSVDLHSGREVRLSERRSVSTEQRLNVEAAGAIARLAPGDVVRLADGLIELRVLELEDGGVRCTIVHGGVLRSRQGVNIPGVDLGVSALTRKDRNDLAFGLKLGVDAVALSFVREAADVLALKRVVKRLGAPEPFIVSKIERADALDHLDEILEESSGVMVARGDLGVEIGFHKVPAAQQLIIETARRANKPVITATQMLESMIERPTPTRAEVSDVAWAVSEGTDALMLSGETAVGRYPVEAVRVLDTVARESELQRPGQPLWRRSDEADLDVPQAVCRAARVVARSVGAAAVLAFTESGRTASLLASQRVARRCYGFTPDERTWRSMRMLWGIEPMLMSRHDSVNAMLAQAEQMLRERRLVKRGDRLVIICGEMVDKGSTNSIHVREVGIFQEPPQRKRKKRAKARP